MDDVYLVSLMDHTPGQRQFVDTDAYRTYYSKDRQWSDQEFQIEMARMQERRARNQGREALRGRRRSSGRPCPNRADPRPSHEA